MARTEASSAGLDGSELLKTLPARSRRGSKPRCHWITDGTASEVARRLTDLAAPWASVTADDRWMPEGFKNQAEAQLHEAPRLLDAQVADALGRWWLGDVRSERRTPNFDIASTCRIEGKPGLLLVEAKAHHVELSKESAGRPLGKEPSFARLASHKTIGAAIQQAANGLSQDLGIECRLSRDCCYQMSNRFAWAWKLASMKIPVVLIYLGFLGADEMVDRGPVLVSDDDWESAVRDHGGAVIDPGIWNKRWLVAGSTPFACVTASMRVNLDGSTWVPGQP